MDPDDNKIIEFNNGIPIGLNGLIEFGGQLFPIEISGEILLWKNVQKKLMKNIISEIMNTIILILNMFIVFEECIPCKDDSVEISFHQFKDLRITIMMEIEIE